MQIDNQRQPYAEKDIKDLTTSDTFVSVSGMILSKTENSIVIDDGTGTLFVSIENPSFGENTFIRTMGRLIPYEDNFQLQANLIQDLSKIDKLLYKKVKELLK